MLNTNITLDGDMLVLRITGIKAAQEARAVSSSGKSLSFGSFAHKFNLAGRETTINGNVFEVIPKALRV